MNNKQAVEKTVKNPDGLLQNSRGFVRERGKGGMERGKRRREEERRGGGEGEERRGEERRRERERGRAGGYMKLF